MHFVETYVGLFMNWQYCNVKHKEKYRQIPWENLLNALLIVLQNLEPF